MRKLLIAAAATLALSACATATPYAPAGPGHRDGYSEYRVSADRWRVSFAGNSVTSRDTVEMYLLYRAAELTVQQGYDWFETVNRATERDTRYVGSPDPWWGASPWGPYWHPYWRFHRRGYWSSWDPFWGDDFDVREVTRYEANGEIIMHRGPRPSGGGAFDAREVMDNLGPRIMRPQAPR